MTVLCEKCFPPDGKDREIYTVPPILPCEECGSWKNQHDYANDPRLEINELDAKR